MTRICPGCNEPYERLGQHWNYSPDHRPSLTSYQYEMLTGLLMGDATIPKHFRRNPWMSVLNTSLPFLEHVSEELGCLAGEPGLKSTAEEQSDIWEDQTGTRYECSDLHRLRTTAHPELHPLAEWYESGEKRFPADTELTPVVLRYWYACDGTIRHPDDDTTRSSLELRINVANERDRIEWVLGLFDSLGVEAVQDRNHVRFRADDSRSVLQYMSESVPGYERKFPSRYL